MKGGMNAKVRTSKLYPCRVTTFLQILSVSWDWTRLYLTAVLGVWCQLYSVLIMVVKMASPNMQIRQPCHVVTCRYLHMKGRGMISFIYFFRNCPWDRY